MVQFGKPREGRIYTEIGFYDLPGQDIPANSVYFPSSTSDCFGVTTEPLKAGAKGYFACQGTFAFSGDAINPLVYPAFAPVYVTVTDQIGTPSATGTKFIGYTVEAKTASDPTLYVMVVVPPPVVE